MLMSDVPSVIPDAAIIGRGSVGRRADRDCRSVVSNVSVPVAGVTVVASPAGRVAL